ERLLGEDDERGRRRRGGGRESGVAVLEEERAIAAVVDVAILVALRGVAEEERRRRDQHVAGARARMEGAREDEHDAGARGPAGERGAAPAVAADEVAHGEPRLVEERVDAVGPRRSNIPQVSRHTSMLAGRSMSTTRRAFLAAACSVPFVARGASRRT